MKMQYKDLSKEEKKDLRNEYYLTNRGKEIKKRFKKLYSYEIILLIFFVYNLISVILKLSSKWWLIFCGIILFFMIFFEIGIISLKKKEFDIYMVKKYIDKKKSKK